MFGMALQVKRFDMSQGLRFAQPRRVGHGCVGSEIDEHTVCSDSTLCAIAQCDMNGARRDERAIAENELISRAAKFVQMDFDERVNHFAFARVDPRHVDGRWPGLDPKLPMAGYQRSDLGRINDVLARQTRHIGTGPADIFPLNDGGSSSCLGHVPGHDLAGGAGSEHNVVVPFWRAHVIHFLLCIEKTADDRGCVLGILLRKEVATLHCLSFRVWSPVTPKYPGNRLPSCRTYRADHPPPTDATWGIRFASRLPYPDDLFQFFLAPARNENIGA